MKDTNKDTNMEEMKCPNCRIPMEVTENTDDVVNFKCLCGRTEKRIKERKIFVQT